jgi:vacuolar protein sorting-associated protein 41
MAAENDDEGPRTPKRERHPAASTAQNEPTLEQDEEEEEDDEEDDDDDTDDEPKLKYTRLTENLGSVYRNGDATSAFMVAGDKMVWSLED